MEIVPTIPLAPQVLAPVDGVPGLTDGAAGFANLFEAAAASLTAAQQESTAGSGDSAFGGLLPNAGRSEAAESGPTSEDTAEAENNDAGNAALAVLIPQAAAAASDHAAAAEEAGDLRLAGILTGTTDFPAGPGHAAVIDSDLKGTGPDGEAAGKAFHEVSEPEAVPADTNGRPARTADTKTAGTGISAAGPDGMQQEEAAADAEGSVGLPDGIAKPGQHDRLNAADPSGRSVSPEPLPDAAPAHGPAQPGTRPEAVPEQPAIQAVAHPERQHAPVSTAAVEAPALRQTAEPKFHLIRRDEQTFEVHVEPEGLGMLDIRIVLDRGTVSAHIIAAEDRVRDFMGQHLDSLASALAAEGVKVGDLSVGGRGREPGTMHEEHGRGTPDKRQDDTVLQNRTRDAGSGISIFV